MHTCPMTSLTHKHTFWFTDLPSQPFPRIRPSDALVTRACNCLIWPCCYASCDSLCDALLMDRVDPHTPHQYSCNFSCSDRAFWYEWCNLSSYSRSHNLSCHTTTHHVSVHNRISKAEIITRTHLVQLYTLYLRTFERSADRNGDWSEIQLYSQPAILSYSSCGSELTMHS